MDIGQLGIFTKGESHISFYADIEPLIHSFIEDHENHKDDMKLFNDTKDHYEKTKYLNENLFANFDGLSSEKIHPMLKRCLIKKRDCNLKQILKQVDNDFDNVKRILRIIRDFNKANNKVNAFNKLISVTGKDHIRGGGIYFITQLLAGAYPDDYVVVEDSLVQALVDLGGDELGITPTIITKNKGDGYILVNSICKKILEINFIPYLEQRQLLDKYPFGLALVHNFLWHHNKFYVPKGIWF
ncbi:MAG: hypothetical protein WC890_04255 [Candidatus Margulisiibacteriota bacterium]